VLCDVGDKMLKHCSLERFLKKKQNEMQVQADAAEQNAAGAHSRLTPSTVFLLLFLKNRFPAHFYYQEREAAWLHGEGAADGG
jgi:hypothetical protein